MKTFNSLCKEFERLDPLTYGVLLTEKSVKILPELKKITEDGIEGTTLFAAFILGSIVADGKIDENEYLLLSPMLHTFFGESMDYETCRQLAKYYKKEGKEFKKYLDLVVDLLGQISDDLKDDIITVCLLICCVDGKISSKEKKWIRQLIRE